MISVPGWVTGIRLRGWAMYLGGRMAQSPFPSGEGWGEGVTANP